MATPADRPGPAAGPSKRPAAEPPKKPFQQPPEPNPKTRVPQKYLDIEVDLQDPWGPMAVRTYYHPHSQSWKCGMLPHFNFMSLDKVRLHDSFGGGQIQAPSFFDRDFSVFHHATFESPSHADRPKIIAEFKKSNVLRGVKLLTIPKSQDNANWGLMARYGGYKSVNAAATWGATQGADILGEYGKYKARKWDRNSSTVPSPKIYSEIEKLDDPDSDLRATIEGIFQSETMVIAIAQVLRHHKTRDEPCPTRRYTHHDSLAGDGVHRILGYDTEDWNRCLVTVITCTLRKPKYMVDAKPSSQAIPPLHWKDDVAADVKPKSADASMTVSDYTYSATSKYVEMLRSLRPKTSNKKQRPEAEGVVDMPEQHILYMLGANPTTSLSTVQESRLTASGIPQYPQVNVTAIKAVIRQLEAQGKQTDISEVSDVMSFGNLLQPGRMTRFLANAEALAEAQAIHHQKTADELLHGSHDVAELSESFLVQAVMPAHEPPKVDFRRALEATGLRSDQWAEPALNPSVPEFMIKPHQVVDAYLMREAERSPIKGSILANDCGTGKTITFFLLQHNYHIECVDFARRGVLDRASPMLLLCPAPLVYQHADELRRHFKGLLHPHI